MRAALAPSTEGLGNKYMYSSLFLVKMMVLSRLIPSYVFFQEIAAGALELLFPQLMQYSIQRLLQVKHVFPSQGYKHYIRLALDIALLLWRRDVESEAGEGGRNFSATRYVRFTGADSSPQLGNNWLNSATVSIKSDEALEVFHAVQRMIVDCGIRQRDSDWEQSERSKEDHGIVLAALQHIHDIPVALGSSAESTANKCAAMLHQWAVLMGDRRKLPEYTESVFSFCSDMAQS